MLTRNKIKSIFRKTDSCTDGRFNCAKLLSNKKYVISSIVLIGLLIVFISYSFAALTPTPSITVPSTTLSYAGSEEGAWQYTKSAYWLSKNKARINIKVDTIKKKRADYTDVILVLDTSGSMLGTKLTQVQNDVNELINDTIPKGNKIALITFNDSATVVNDFTNDTTLLQESINNLTVSGETNYYQALIKVDDVLSTYNKESNRDCVVLFLTDGLPTIDTPNEVSQYKYLKSKYNYLDINGIQYELGNTVLTGIKNITDTQYLANKENLNEFLYKASLTTATYDEFTLTDYVDTNYFNLNNVTDINTTFGKTNIQSNKVIWNLSGLKSGTDATLTIDINFNNNLIGVGGIYPTHTKTDITCKIGNISTTESTTKTTILKDKYTVIYEGNIPAGCVVSNVPGTINYFVFDTVQKENTIPVCAGYQFQGWKIVTAGVKEVNEDTFIMPDKNVTLRATWKKLSITKSMDGTVSKVQTLYRLIADSSIGLDTNVNFNSTPTDANSGVYTIASTASDTYPVHYYRGNIKNNNVLFAGFCWKMVRTTSTGGVKLIYNGIPKDDYDSSIPISQDKYINISNDASYPYTYNTSTNKWTSTNKTHSKTGTISFSVAESGTYVLAYSVSSEANYDKAYFYKDGTELGVYSGTASGTISLGELTSSNVIQVKYAKDGSNSSGTDSVTFSIDKASGNAVKSCNNTGTDSQIGTSAFNLNVTSPADVGYMDNGIYKCSKYSFPMVSVLAYSYAASTNYYYGTSVTYSSSTGKYTLQNAEQKSWSDNYSTLTGYYTCGSTSTTCSTVYYIAGTDRTYQYTLSLSGSVTDPDTQTITLGKGIADNGNNTYTLTDAVTVKKSDWFINYRTYKNYYMCKDLTSTTCDGMYIIVPTNLTLNTNTSVDRFIITYDDTFKYVYGNDVVWDGTKYTLTDTYTSTLGWNNDRRTLAKKYHYTCLNTTGECTDVYYINYFGDSSYIYYLKLSSGKNIEGAKNAMFTNTGVSQIKGTIDSWYKTNMTGYTEKLEDTIFCNDRTLYSGSLAGKDVDAGTGYSYFSAYNRIYTKHSPSVECPNKSRDGFTVSTSSGGNGKLTYPVGLLTADEVMLAGGRNASNSNYYLYTGQYYWLLTPSRFDDVFAIVFYVGNIGDLHSSGVNSSIGARPSVSLAPGTRTAVGDGTVYYPYVIEED